MVSNDPTPTVESPDANMVLKYMFGVSEWKRWVQMKNDEQAGRGKPFKMEILQCTADELNFSLCLFVKEARREDGEEYSPDTIYNMCLGRSDTIYNMCLGRSDTVYNMCLGRSDTVYNMCLGRSDTVYNMCLGRSDTDYNICLGASQFTCFPILEFREKFVKYIIYGSKNENDGYG